MTGAETPYRRGSAAARGWRTFRRWRRGRPFWGGLITILSGVVFFLSGHIALGGLKISFGPQEFFGWLIPLILLLCGLLMLFTPGQRIFYGVLAAAVSVGGLIGLNLGGFLVGMVLGMIGGALGASWTPVQLPPAAQPPAAEPDAGAEPNAGQPAGEPDAGAEGYATDDYEPAPAGHGSAPEHEAWPLRGPLADTLPTSMTSPLAGRPAAPPGAPPTAPPVAPRAEGTDGPDQDGGWLPWRSPRGLAVILLVTATAVGLTVARAQTPAAAAPSCGTAAGVTAVSARGGLLGGIGNLVATVTGTDPSGSPSPSEAAPSSAAPSSPAPSAGPSGSTSPEPAGTTAGPTPGATTPTPKSAASPSPTCPAAAALIAPADQTVVNEKPSQQITAVLSQLSLSYDGVTELRTAHGTIPVLQFSMDSSTSTPFELRVPLGGHTLDYRSSQLTVSGHVRFYTSRLDGTLAGKPQSYTPDNPPPLPPGIPVPVALVFTDVTLELVLVHADVLTAPGLGISYAS